MRAGAIAFAAGALLLLLPGRSPGLDSSSLWPKLLQILQRVEALEEQNKEILQNQQRILEQLNGIRDALEQQKAAGEKAGGE